MRTHFSDRDALALKLRNCYQFERNLYARVCQRSDDYRVPPCWDIKGRRGPEARKELVWHKLARFCRDRQIDPVRYLQWCLDMGQLLLKAPPEPNQLLAPARMDAYLDDLPKQRQKVALALRIQKGLAERHVAAYRATGEKPRRALARTLSATHLELSPLFRHGVARRIVGKMFERIAANNEPDALFQYQRHPQAYSEIWGEKFVPPDFAERAARHYDELLAQEP